MVINTNWYTVGQGMPRDEGEREDMKGIFKRHREDIRLKCWPDSHLTLMSSQDKPMSKHQLVYSKYEWFTVYQLNSNKILPYPPHTHTKAHKNGTAHLPPWTHPQKLQAVQKKSPFSPQSLVSFSSTRLGKVESAQRKTKRVQANSQPQGLKNPNRYKEGALVKEKC